MESCIYKDDVKWSDSIFSIILTTVISFWTGLPTLHSVLLISFYPILFLLFSKRYKFYKSYFVQDGLLLSPKKKYSYSDVTKYTIQNQSYARKTISFYFEDNKRVNVHYDDKSMGELLSILSDINTTVDDKG